MNAAAALMERTPFAIDDAKDDDDEDEDELDIGDNDDQVMDEVSFFLLIDPSGTIRFMDGFFYLFKVDAFLEAHDSGLTDADKKVVDGKLCAAFIGVMLNCELDLLHAEPLK